MQDIWGGAWHAHHSSVSACLACLKAQPETKTFSCCLRLCELPSFFARYYEETDVRGGVAVSWSFAYMVAHMVNESTNKCKAGNHHRPPAAAHLMLSDSTA